MAAQVVKHLSLTKLTKFINAERLSIQVISSNTFCIQNDVNNNRTAHRSTDKRSEELRNKSLMKGEETGLNATLSQL
jgi:hypothetical protein